MDAASACPLRQVNRRQAIACANSSCNSVTGDAVETHEKAHSYEVEDNELVVVEDEELERAHTEARTNRRRPTQA